MSSEWFTPVDILRRVRAVLGGIDLDPASCAVANQRVGALTYFDQAADGLAQRWAGRVFCNPPSPALPWWEKLMATRAEGTLADAVLVAFNIELLQVSQGREHPPLAGFPLCAPARRVRYLRPDGAPGDRPRFGSLIAYVPGTLDRTERFAAAFAGLGAILLPWDAP